MHLPLVILRGVVFQSIHMIKKGNVENTSTWCIVHLTPACLPSGPDNCPYLFEHFSVVWNIKYLLAINVSTTIPLLDEMTAHHTLGEKV